MEHMLFVESDYSLEELRLIDCTPGRRRLTERLLGNGYLLIDNAIDAGVVQNLHDSIENVMETATVYHFLETEDRTTWINESGVGHTTEKKRNRLFFSLRLNSADAGKYLAPEDAPTLDYRLLTGINNAVSGVAKLIASKVGVDQQFPDFQGSLHCIDYTRPKGHDEDNIWGRAKHVDQSRIVGHIAAYVPGQNLPDQSLKVYDRKGRKLSTNLGKNQILITLGSLWPRQEGEVQQKYKTACPHGVEIDGNVMQRIAFTYWV